MKKVCVLSYVNTANYGGLLQLYALSTILSKHFDVEVINYKNGSKIQRSKIRTILAFFYNKVFPWLSIDKVRKQNELKFRSLIPISNTVYSNAQHLGSIDCNYFIVGSDQVWNPYLNGFDSAYLLRFKTNATKISYAASFGVEKIPNNWLDDVSYSLAEFKHISLRENTGCNILEQVSSLAHISKTVDLDPTLLINQNDWKSKFCTSRLLNFKYILVYLMPGDKIVEKQMIKYAHLLSRKSGNKVVIIGRKNIDKFNFTKRGYYKAGPSEFVNLINYSEFVVTNSFHGTAFSVNLNKQFVSFINSNRETANSLKSRVVDFLSKVSLQDRVVDVKSVSDTSFPNSDIDFKKINEVLSSLKTRSLDNLFEGAKE